MAPAHAHEMPLYRLYNWSPFRLDALGLVTLLGADEVTLFIGALRQSRLTEYLPLLGAFKVAANQFAQPLPGFTLYNVTQGIYGTEFNGWITRWLITHLKKQHTVLHFTVTQSPNHFQHRGGGWLAVLIGILVNGGLLAIAVLQDDWYGTANAIAMAVSVLVRSALVNRSRRTLEAKVDNYRTKVANPALSAEVTKMTKILITLPDGKTAIVHIPRGLVAGCLILQLDPHDDYSYGAMRAIGWLAFACHILTIGQSYLLTQIVAVVILAGATVLSLYRVGCGTHEESCVGNWLTIQTENVAGLDRRQKAYAELEPTESEESIMCKWSLFPEKSTNRDWWKDYESEKAIIAARKQLPIGPVSSKEGGI